jgi:hypothetical protein
VQNPGNACWQVAFPHVRAFFPADNGARKLSAKHKEGHKLPGILKNGEKQIT